MLRQLSAETIEIFQFSICAQISFAQKSQLSLRSIFSALNCLCAQLSLRTIVLCSIVLRLIVLRSTVLRSSVLRSIVLRSIVIEPLARNQFPKLLFYLQLKDTRTYGQLYLYYAPRTMFSEELELYTTLSLIAEIGGHVGLFIGLSFWNFAEFFSSILETTIKKLEGKHA